MSRKIILGLCLLLVTGCTSSSTNRDPIGIIEPELVQIETNHPDTKENTDAIRKAYPIIKKQQEKAESKDDGFRKYLPWLFVAIGIALGGWGIYTEDIEDTFAGVFSVIIGIAIYAFFDWIAIGGIIILIISVIGVWVLSNDWKKIRKTNNNE